MSKIKQLFRALEGQSLIESEDYLRQVLSDQDIEVLAREYRFLEPGPALRETFNLSDDEFRNLLNEKVLNRSEIRTRPQRFKIEEVINYFRGRLSGSRRWPVFQLSSKIDFDYKKDEKTYQGYGQSEDAPLPVWVRFVDKRLKLTLPIKAGSISSDYIWCQFTLNIKNEEEPDTHTVEVSDDMPKKIGLDWFNPDPVAYPELFQPETQVKAYAERILSHGANSADAGLWIAAVFHSSAGDAAALFARLEKQSAKLSLKCPSSPTLYRLLKQGQLISFLKKEGCEKLPVDDQVARMLAKCQSKHVLPLWRVACEKSQNHSKVTKNDMFQAAAEYSSKVDYELNLASELKQQRLADAITAIRPHLSSMLEQKGVMPESSAVKDYAEVIFNSVGLDPDQALLVLAQRVEDESERVEGPFSRT